MQVGRKLMTMEATLDTNGLKIGAWIETGFGQAQIAGFEEGDEDSEGEVVAVGTLGGCTFRLGVYGLVAL
jgi:hypothetical protein